MRLGVLCPSTTGPDAQALLGNDRLVVLAAEIIGQGIAADLVAVALLNRHGEVLVHTRIQPSCPIPALADAPRLEVVWPTLAALLTNRIVVGFHVTHDRRVLRHAARRLGATVMYADWRGVGARVCCSTPRPPTCSPTRAALTEARTALAALRALAGPPIPMHPPRQIFWRYL